jgi:hypothetical protein
MYSFRKINLWSYKFNTSVGSIYSIILKRDSIESVEVVMLKDLDNNDNSSDVYNIMQTVSAVISDYINNNPQLNNIDLNVIGSGQDDIDQKISLYIKYIPNLSGTWVSQRTGNLLKLIKQ